MYEVGKVYVWVKCDSDSSMVGKEVTVIEPVLFLYSNALKKDVLSQKTDSINSYGHPLNARPGYLRPKNPPSGEQLVRDLFEPKPVMEPA